MADVFTELKNDHQNVKSILTQLGTVTDVEERGKLAEQLVMDESRHEAAEEEYFWPKVRDAVTGGDELADTAIAQEDEGKEVLDQIEKATAGTPEFDQLIAKFTNAAHDHIAFEERQVWPKLDAVLDTNERNELGDKIDKARSSGPTRPHPNAPAGPGALKTVGVVAAVSDKARDKVSGRGS